jgi:hypothetical protein
MMDSAQSNSHLLEHTNRNSQNHICHYYEWKKGKSV